jgi:hypothetical protein
MAEKQRAAQNVPFCTLRLTTAESAVAEHIDGYTRGCHRPIDHAPRSAPD